MPLIKVKRVSYPFCKYGHWVTIHQSPFHQSSLHPELSTNRFWRLKNSELPGIRLSCGKSCLRAKHFGPSPKGKASYLLPRAHPLSIQILSSSAYTPSLRFLLDSLFYFCLSNPDYVYVFLTTKVLLDISLLYMNNKQQLPSIIAINYINSYNISYSYTICNTILLKTDSYISYSMNVIVYHNIPVSIHCLIGLQC